MLSLIKDVRTLRGGSQPHLMQASDGNYYIVKFQGNPQGTRVLANELLASRIAEVVGLPVPRADVVHLSNDVAAGMKFETPGGNIPVRPGLQCAVRIVISPLQGRMYEFLPSIERGNIRNRGDLTGAVVFDFWTRNIDSRQQIYWRRCVEKKFTVAFIDNGHCFGGPEWKIMGNPLSFAEQSTAPEFWEWIRRMQSVTRNQLSTLASEIPPEWYGNDNQALEAMLDGLCARRSWFRSRAQARVNGFVMRPQEPLVLRRSVVPVRG